MKKTCFLLLVIAVLFSSCRNGTGSGSTPENPVIPDNPDNIFYFTAGQDNVNISLKRVSDSYKGTPAPVVNLLYSTDLVNWAPLVVNETSVTLRKAGEKLFLKADNTNETFSIHVSVPDGYALLNHYFTASDSVSVGGNIMYLLDGTGTKNSFDEETNFDAFEALFSGMKTLTDASELLLPAMTLSGCCYITMFANCENLKTAPALPAVEMKNSCYGGMFYGCKSLMSAPELPATTLADYCYSNMFYGCSSLTEAPKLPAETMAEGCYRGMFEGCSKMYSIQVYFTDWSSDIYATQDWLKDASTGGSFVCPKSLDNTVRNDSHVPSGWTILTR